MGRLFLRVPVLVLSCHSFPLYIEELGAPESQIELFSGLAISVTAFAAAIIAPVWGNLADQKVVA